MLFVVADSPRDASEECILDHVCGLCTGSDKQSIKACSETGKIEQLKCTSFDEEGKNIFRGPKQERHTRLSLTDFFL
jgi:hypothetical protein